MKIDILNDDFNFAFKVTYWNEQGKANSYTSPFIFESSEDANDEAIKYLWQDNQSAN